MRGRLERFGLLRESGHEHFRGNLVVPIIGGCGAIAQCYGRKITSHLRAGTPDHLYLPGPHTAVWNIDALAAPKEIHLCETDTAIYDESGNTVFTKALYWTPGFLQFVFDSAWNTWIWTEIPGSTIEDRASYYAADGKLYAADYRSVTDNVTRAWGTTFEEYRYDALGRRVWVRSRRFCESANNFECNLSFVRRTVWDGDAELYEIQMPVDTLENDTAPVRLALLDRSGDDPNGYFGRVAYAYGLGIDRPLSVVRFRYADRHITGFQGDIGWWEYPTYAVVPLWNSRGKADDGYFVTVPATTSTPVGSGGQYCPDGAHPQRCVFLLFHAAYDILAYSAWPVAPLTFHGTLIEDKRDKAGTWYRRNRQYDPRTGRFTQEDPIGLAGGMNLYGFAGGDPVNFSDPFGLWKTGVHDWLIARALAKLVGPAGIRTIQNGSREVDSWYNQGAVSAFMHSMNNGWQSSAEAIAARNAFVESRLADARGLEAAGHHDQALAAFGEAIHPLMDSTSPQHTNRDGSPKTWNLVGYSAYRHYKEEGRPTPAQRDATIKMIQEKYQSVFGKP